MIFKEENVYYCEECNKIYNSCYEFDGVTMCISCWSENIQKIPENKILPFIRKKRLKRINQISEK